MTEDLRDLITGRYEVLKKISKRTEEKLKNYPNGRIYIKHQNNSARFYLSGEDYGSEEILLGVEDAELIENLLQKSYLEKVMKAIKSEMTALRRMKKLYPELIAEEVYEQLSEDRKRIVKPIVPTNEQFAKRWQEKPYEHAQISDDIPVYLTLKGERVRSKSEVIIADRLYAKGIPYKYECPLKVGKKTIHPDFTILRLSDREVVYYEHCGRMDDPQYAEDMVKRVNDYSNAGIIVGEKLFLTFETSKTPMDVRVLDRMIDANFR